LAVGENRKKKY